ncbi:malate dehydrogenase [Rothia sp. ZJ932]|uniref:malate dehydrogenase n=1 Tax=Rothia sp. ZJ932 TaxID=2810516 RepID=UPI00196852D8|nr:malate dehydrogenase [Rothia sp. ZJ932]QRZ60898.1 malate dehydrogenase [Rothia sp. ZJ932]
MFTSDSQSQKKPVTITLTGAGGQIGYATMFRIAAGEMLGADTPVRLRLLEIPPRGVKAAEGAAMELEDCAFELLESVDIFDDPQQAFEGANIGMLIGAHPRTAGMERADLLEANGAIFSQQGAAISKSAADDIKVVVVGNPANTNALIAASHAPDVPSERFTALTRLDHHRALAQLAAATNTRVSDIKKLAIWGNHSASQYPDVFNARIAGRAARGVLREHGKDEQWISGVFIPKVAKRGAEIIEVRGGSSVASAAHGAISHMRSWILGSGGEPVSMGVLSAGQYGVTEGIISSFPVICDNGCYEIDNSYEIDEFSQKYIDKTVQELLDEKEAVKTLGLLGESL